MTMSFATSSDPKRQRVRRGRRLAQGYAMAEEIAPWVRGAHHLADVGCGDGTIAYHLSALVGCEVQGFDVGPATVAPIPYEAFDGVHLPAESQQFDALLLCYVLHHAQDASALLAEVARVLEPGGRVVVYEDVPATWFDRVCCWRHERRWLQRTGPCTFEMPRDWERTFEAYGLKVLARRALSRWRDPTHPVERVAWVLERCLA